MSSDARKRFHLVEFTNPSGALAWRVDGKDADGKRVRKNFADKAEAQSELQKLIVEADNSLSSVHLIQTRLTQEQVKDAEAAAQKLKDKSLNRSLLEAVDYFVKNWREPVRTKSAKDALDEFLAAKRKENLRAHSIENLRAKCNLLVALNPSRRMDEISPAALDDVIFKPGTSPRRHANVRRVLHNFFGWAKRQGYCADNPVASISPVKLERDEPEALSLAQVRKLLEAASNYKDGKLAPYVALSLFAGIRPTELARLTWDEIDLQAGTITIGPKMAKMRARRVIDMVKPLFDKNNKPAGRANLLDWLTPYALRKQPFVAPNFQKDFDAVKEAAGFGTPTKEKPHLKPWVQDYLRHTAISNHLAWLKHEGDTALWAGNSPTVVQKHYRALVTAVAAKEFWSITPDKKKLIRLPTATAEPTAVTG
jgi:integrase